MTSLFAGAIAAGALAYVSTVSAALADPSVSPGLAALAAFHRWDGAGARTVGRWDAQEARWWESWELSPDGSIVSIVEWTNEGHAIQIWDAGTGDWIATAWNGTDLRSWMDQERIAWRTDAEWKDWARATIWNLRAAHASAHHAANP